MEFAITMDGLIQIIFGVGVFMVGIFLISSEMMRTQKPQRFDYTILGGVYIAYSLSLFVQQYLIH